MVWRALAGSGSHGLLSYGLVWPVLASSGSHGCVCLVGSTIGWATLRMAVTAWNVKDRLDESRSGSRGAFRKGLSQSRRVWARQSRNVREVLVQSAFGLATSGIERQSRFCGPGWAWRVYARNVSFWQSHSCKLGLVTHWQGRDRVFLPVQAEPKEVQNDDKRETARNKR